MTSNERRSQAISAEARAQVILMLKVALRGVKNFPKFVMGQFEIVLKFAAELGAITGKQMMRLAEEGVLLLKGVTEGEVGWPIPHRDSGQDR